MRFLGATARGKREEIFSKKDIPVALRVTSSAPLPTFSPYHAIHLDKNVTMVRTGREIIVVLYDTVSVK